MVVLIMKQTHTLRLHAWSLFYIALRITCNFWLYTFALIVDSSKSFGENLLYRNVWVPTAKLQLRLWPSLYLMESSIMICMVQGKWYNWFIKLSDNITLRSFATSSYQVHGSNTDATETMYDYHISIKIHYLFTAKY